MKLIVVNAVQLVSLAGVCFALSCLSRVRRPRLQLLVAAGAGLACAKYLFTRSEPWDKFADFREAYWLAGKLVLAGPARLEPLLKLGSDGFVNFPIVAYLFAPLGALPAPLAERVYFVLGFGAVLASWAMLVRMYAFSASEQALSLYLLLTFGPLLYSLREGNTSHVLLLALLWALSLLRQRRDLWAGAVLGVLAFIKLPMLLVGVYFALRRRWHAFAAYWGAFGVLAALSLAVFGVRMHVLWYEGCIKPFGRDPMPAFNAQSFASAVSRFELGALHLRDWVPQPLSSMGRLVVASVTVLLLAAPLLVAWRASRLPVSEADATRRHEHELLLASVLSCLISSLCWSHYYVWLVPAAAFLLVRARDGSGRAMLALGWLLAQPAVFLDGHAGSGVWGTVLLALRSHLLWGALIIYAALLWSSEGSGSPTTHSS